MAKTLMWYLAHFHRHDFVYFDHHRVTKRRKEYAIWRKRGKFWELVMHHPSKVIAFVLVCHRALVMESDSGPISFNDPVRENVTRNTVNLKLDELDEILLAGLQDDPAVRDMLLDVLQKGG
jgi:hypothetical protein